MHLGVNIGTPALLSDTASVGRKSVDMIDLLAIFLLSPVRFLANHFVFVFSNSVRGGNGSPATTERYVP